MQTVISLSNNKTVGQISSTPAVNVPPPALLYKTLSVVRYIPFIGAGGLFLFKTVIWINYFIDGESCKFVLDFRF